ncbi:MULTISPECIES: PepSY domain-containing protein [unclassified Pseudoalteromonas]|uniref:PepSY domain-containing protein n=1 Tax=unclassified Pseudoalteromonas TaxID=194690 RepID=UPI002097C6CD|nr:PepSY domain-containing protein [Pseudoalteromonas sp. XMcav2-N]MCO7187248.1 PepSY domain-containing protein [Pseudoalteromonas sp. XMcav2-N]
MQLPRCFATALICCLLGLHSAQATEKQDTISKKQAVKLATDQYAGKTLKISKQGDYYIVRILRDDGRIIDLKVHQVTGEVKKD